MDRYFDTVEFTGINLLSIQPSILVDLVSRVSDADACIVLGTDSISHHHYLQEVLRLPDLQEIPTLLVMEHTRSLSWLADSMVGGFRHLFGVEEFDTPSEYSLLGIGKFFDALQISPKPKTRSYTPATAASDTLRPLNEGKLILVGRGEVGKTSLARRLTGESFRGDESKTQGINITSWQIQNSGDGVRLNIWDFGGQEIMHATHQFFLTERSLYLLVLNGREGGEDLDAEYWLRLIEAFGGESPIIIVQNKSAQQPFELNYRGLRARYPQIQDFHQTDCKENTGIDAVRNSIQTVIGAMKEVCEKIPSDWLYLKNRIEGMSEDFLNYQGFRQLCAEQGITEDKDVETLSVILHCLGIALNYRDDSRLRETSILRPEWLTKGVYSILNDSNTAARKGELHINDLQTLLPSRHYPVEKHNFLLELMRKFSLCFRFQDQEDRYLIPELLGKEEPEDLNQQFARLNCLCFEYHYAVLPEGLIPRFIARSHALSRNHPRWRSGVILEYDECLALVESRPSENRVVVRVRGIHAQSRRELLALVRHDMERINAEFKDRLEVIAKVPLPDHPEHAIDYKELVTFERGSVGTFPVAINGKIVQVNVAELLNGVDLDEQRSIDAAGIRHAKSVFLSYSHKDEKWRDQLETHLKLLQRQNVIRAWTDRKILPGMEWDKEIDRNLNAADIILLLVSADFLASDYCWDIEIRRAMERHEANEAVVVPIMLRMCDLTDAPFSRLKGLPKDMEPLVNDNNEVPDRAWTEVARGLREIAAI